MRGLITKLMGDVNKKQLRKLEPMVDKINSFEAGLQQLADEALRQKTAEFREQLDNVLTGPRAQVQELVERMVSNADTLDRRVLADANKKLFQAEQDALWQLLPEAFAVVREASWRVLGMRHFDVQLLGGIILHQGRIAEMKTGEGKTLAATLPAYLNALARRGVHIVTVNDYLAARDMAWMGPVYQFLGLSVGLIVHGIDSVQRRQSYAADITYGTNNEFGFDYLRDNMVLYQENLSQRPLNFAIVDEVDSILIDEARTPLIISGQMKDGKQQDDYVRIEIGRASCWEIV